MPRQIKYKGAQYRRAQDDLEELIGDEMEEGQPAKPGDFSFKNFQLGDGANAMARMLVAGLAAKLAQDGVSKEAVKKAKINEASANFTAWLKAVVAEKAAFKEELRLLQRYGPQQYLAKKAQQLKAIK